MTYNISLACDMGRTDNDPPSFAVRFTLFGIPDESLADEISDELGLLIQTYFLSRFPIIPQLLPQGTLQ